jgi:hypothetical protein
MSTFLSSRLRNLKVGIEGYTDGTQVGEIIGDVDIKGGLKVAAFNDGTSTGLTNYVVTSDGDGGWAWESLSDIGAITAPGGVNKQIQFNNSGLLGGASNFYYDFVNSRVGIGTDAPEYLVDVDGDVYIRGALRDKDKQAGTFGQVLMSTGTGIDWVEAAPVDAITGLNIYEEGVLQGGANAVASLDFVGSYITATVVGSTATITLSSSPNFDSLTVNLNTVWHAGNDGANSGLDADLLDGQQGSHYLDYNNFTNKPFIPGVLGDLSNVDDNFKVDKSVLTYNQTSGKFVANDVNTIITITDGGNF